MTDLAEHLVPDLLEVAVPVGGRVVVMSDLHFRQNADASSELVAADLARLIDGWEGPGVVVLAGDVFDLLIEPHDDPGRILRAHPRLATALRRFVDGPDRRVVVIPGSHDGALAWHAQAVRTLRHELDAEVALTVELCIGTGSGTRRVRVEHGHQLDPANAFVDPRNSGETPLGHHVVRDVLPLVRRPGAEWLDGLDHLTEPSEAAAFMVSRIAYRRLARRMLTLALPFVVSALLALIWVLTGGGPGSGWRTASVVALAVGTGFVTAVAVATAWWRWALQRPLTILRKAELPGLDEPHNDAPRAAARRLLGQGYDGLITGHTHEPELTDLGGGFYANTGGGGTVVERRRGRFGLPSAYAVCRRLSWIELEAGARLHTRLSFARQPLPSTTVLERLCTHPVKVGTPQATVVATWPHGAQWPRPEGHDLAKRRKVRRLSSAGIATAGLVNVVSSIVPPFSDRLRVLTGFVPLAVPQVAAVLVALSGVALLLLARGVRRGQRRAWAVALGVLGVTTVLHVAKGLDIDESLVSLGIFAFLLANKRDFNARVDEGSAQRGLLTVCVGIVAAVVAGVLAVEVFNGGSARLPLSLAIEAVAERLVGVTVVAVPHNVDRFLQPTLLATSLGLAVAAGWMVFRPVVASRLAARPAESVEQARRIVETYGGDTLAYFALRHDKRFFFNGDTLIAYAVYRSVCLVSPDPIGPVAERRVAWAAFRAFADDHGWAVAVMAAGDSWLPIYEASGMRDLYVGDEAVVDVRRFNLEGGKNKGLRQAVNRVAKYGYRAEFHDPAHIDPELERKLRLLMTESRRGEVERGFSMTLGRIFDPADEGLLLTVCFGPDGEPVAFCQYVPAAAIGGYSLDLMRRSEGKHPNGLTDFVVVETIRHLRQMGKNGLGLNFATMRAVLAGERGDGIAPRVQRWFLERMSDSMQIESLWRFNAKFDPDWLPRHAVYDAPENLITSAMAVAKAESFYELPVVGRLFKPSHADHGLPAVPGARPGHPAPSGPECEPVPVPVPGGASPAAASSAPGSGATGSNGVPAPSSPARASSGAGVPRSAESSEAGGGGRPGPSAGGARRTAKVVSTREAPARRRALRPRRRRWDRGRARGSA